MNALKCEHEGRAAQVAAAAAVLYARVSGYNAENQVRQTQGSMPAFDQPYYEEAIDVFYEELGIPKEGR